jgi:uncharacterized protein (DUF2384 family)
MRTVRKTDTLSEQAIDRLVIRQADDEVAWSKPIRVRKRKSTTMPLSAALSTRAAFFARLHREKSVDVWLSKIIQERLDLEEAAFVDLKRDIASRINE